MDRHGFQQARSPSGVFTEVAGASAEVLVLIHGLGANGAVWDPLMEFAIKEWEGRILIPDLRGHGRSEHRGCYSIGTFAADVAELLGPDDRVSIIGHSLGGAIGALLGTGWFAIDVGVVHALSVKTKWSFEEVAKGREIARNRVRWFDLEDEALDRFLRVSGLRDSKAAVSRAASVGVSETDGRFRVTADPGIYGCAALGVDEMLKAVRCDLALATGERDQIATASDMAACGFHPTVIGGAGHNVHVEQPEAVWRLFKQARSTALHAAR